MKRLCTLVSLVLALSVAACGSEDGGDDGDDGLPFDPVLSEIQTKVFDVSCVFSSCHSESRAAGNLILEPGMSHGELVGVLSDNDAAKNMSMQRVVAGDADSSFLMVKLTVGLDSQFGDLMPQGSLNGLEPAGKIEAIRQWINDGALDN